MEEEDGGAYRSAAGNDTLALNYSQMSSSDAGSVDLVGRLKTLSSGRKKLMTKYFDLDDIESGPLLSEYFAVSLAFVALGAMIREANVRMRRKEKETDGVSPKLQRMALDSMLKSAMERLRGLAHRTQTLEDKVRDRSYMEAAFQFERLEFLKQITALEATIGKHVDAEAAWRKEKEDLIKRIAEVDAQRGYFFKKMAEAESALADLQRLRMEDGKANAKLVEIYAGREQGWKSERIKMRHDIELLKEKLSKLQPTQSQSKSSPHSFDAAADALRMRNLKRRAKEMVRDKAVSERELSVLVGVDRTLKTEVDSRSPKESPVGPADDRKDPEAADTPELSAAQNQEMEAELAIILKRVGALKRRGTSGSKLDELLNEAKGNKPKLKRLGSFDQAPKSMAIDDSFLCRPEANNNVKDVEVDEGAKDIWQAIESQEGMHVQRRNGLVDGVTLPREPSRTSLTGADHARSPVRTTTSLTELCIPTPESNICERVSQVEPLSLDEGGWEEFVGLESPPNTPEKNNIGQPSTSEGLTFVDDRARDSVVVAVNSSSGLEPTAPNNHQIQPLSWDEFPLEKPSALPEEGNSGEHVFSQGSAAVGHDRVPEERVVAVNRFVASEPTVRNEMEPLNLDEGGWEEFVEEKNPNTPESNSVGQHTTPEESSTLPAPESVVVDPSVLTAEPAAVGDQNETLNLDEGGWKSESEGHSVACTDKAPVPSPVHDPVGLIVPVDDDLILFQQEEEEDIKSEIIVNKDQPSSVSQGHQLETGDPGLEIDQTSAESRSPDRGVPDASLAHESVGHSLVPEDVDVKSEIIGSDHMDQLNRTNVLEGQNDDNDASDTGQSSPGPSSEHHLQVTQGDTNNNSVEQVVRDQTSSPSLEPQTS